ncbi:ATP-binding cassette domain-containing protein [Roseateles toxinivorans]|uniref:Amino acid ABC transporter ATP-binding protein (PAAT family) n=1 Tax=Roseateles toxinivorans TaxID=270368 RepID=A0A4R6QU84_9BURK|nr:ATP-binding cassette domain-containing protein [Roseateles toxinivorans]TDP74991.1 amino acid ABC transporter ATP-binding protein (PAAT family) [Roseateles toxinivorans]
MTALLRLDAATVRFGDHTALHPTTLQIQSGERLMLLGANGSGKTTLLRVLHGLQLFEGRRLLADQVLRQAMVAQRPFLLSLSVWHNVVLALWLAGVPRGQRPERARQALARVGLTDMAQRPARVLSGGQQQRLALARAWGLQPQLLFLDEPTANLDPGAKREVEALIEAFAAEGMTLVMSTHNLGQAKRLGTRVLYLEAGKVLADLSPQAFFNGPLPQEAQLFLKGELPWS